MAKLYRYELAMKTKHWIPVGVLGVLGKSRWQTTLRLSFTRKITTCGSKLQAIETPKILYIKNKLLILSGTFKKKKSLPWLVVLEFYMSQQKPCLSLLSAKVCWHFSLGVAKYVKCMCKF